MATLYASNAATLTASINAAKAGDTIILKSGSYGVLKSNKDFTGYVNFKSEVPGGAKFTAVDLDNATNFAFTGIEVAGEFRADNLSKYVKLIDSKVGGGAYFRDASCIVLQGNDITGAINAVTLNDVKYVKLQNNTIHDAQSDLVRVTGKSYDVQILNNKLLDVHAVPGDHPDMIQMIGTNGNTPEKIIVKGNILYDNPATGSTWSQGVFVSDPGAGGYKNILIEDNLINVGSPNGVYINGGVSNVVVRDNVMAIHPDGTGGSIRVVEKSGISNSGTTIEHNLARQVKIETTALSKDLKVVGNTLASLKMADLLAGPVAGVETGFTNLVDKLVDPDLLF